MKSADSSLEVIKRSPEPVDLKVIKNISESKPSTIPTEDKIKLKAIPEEKKETKNKCAFSNERLNLFS